MLPSPRSSLRSPTVWLLLLTFAAEFFLFDHFGSRRVAGLYPRWNDQVQYLSECYTGYEYARAHGLPAGLWHTLTNPSAQGTLHDFAALLEFQLVRPSRSAVLALNMAALIAWQVTLLIAVRRRSGSSALAFVASMLPLVLRGPWEDIPGSAYDFRLDHLALCALGVTSALALLTERFGHRRASVAFGVATGVTLLTRFITGTYFVVIFLALAAWVLAASDRRRRLVNLLLAAAIAAALAGPIFWMNRESVWDYYYIGHYIGPESAIRNQNFGVLRSLQFVFGGLADRHLGSFFAAFAAGLTVVFAALRLRYIREVSARPAAEASPAIAAAPENAPFAAEAIVHGAIFLFAPALVLTLHPQKSEVVLSALAPGVVLIVVGVWIALAGFARDRAAAASLPPGEVGASGFARARRIVVAVALVTALGFFAHRQTVPLASPEAMKQFGLVNALADYVVKTADEARLQTIRVSVDYITDAFDAQVLRVICYERRHGWRDWDMKLPTGIAEPDAAAVRQRLAESDFVFLTDDDATYGGYPYDRKLAALRPELRAWCDAHLVVAHKFTFRGHPMTLYQRRSW